MPNLSIKDVPEDLAEALRQRAARNHRSLQGELMAIIEQAALDTGAPLSGDPGRPRITGYDRQGFPIVRQGWKSIEQIAAEMKMRYPDPIKDQISSIDLVREDRDSR